MFTIKQVLFASASIAIWSSQTLAVTTGELDERLYKIEKAMKSKNPVLPMDAQRFRLGGFLTSAHSYLMNKNTEESSFNSNRFEILIGLDVTENLEFFTAFGIISESELVNEATARRTFGNDTDGDGIANEAGETKNRANKVPLIISHGTYKWSRHANIKFGRFVAPVGIINIEHFPPGLFLETAPRALRPIPGGVIWGHFLNGVDFFGSVAIGNNSLEYHLNYSSFSFLGPANPVNGGTAAAGESTKMIHGGRLAYSFLGDRMTFGLSYQSGLKLGGNLTYGADYYVNWGGFNLKTEYTKADQADSKKEGFMIQPSYAISESVRLVYRYDQFDANTEVNAATAEERTEHIVGVNWLVNSLLRLRTEFAVIDFGATTDANGEDPDYKRLTTTAVLSF